MKSFSEYLEEVGGADISATRLCPKCGYRGKEEEFHVTVKTMDHGEAGIYTPTSTPDKSAKMAPPPAALPAPQPAGEENDSLI